MDVEGCGRLSVHNCLLDVVCFCVCASCVVRWRGMNVSWVVVGESASASALGDRRVCVEVV